MEMLETLLAGVRSACAAFPDKRRGEVTYSMADIGLSAFSLFFMQSESFLAHQRALEEGRKMSNCQSLFGMTAVPTDNHIRAMLDPVHPSHLQPGLSHMALSLALTFEQRRCGVGGMAGVLACNAALRPPCGRVRRLLRRGCGPTAGQRPPRPA